MYLLYRRISGLLAIQRQAITFIAEQTAGLKASEQLETYDRYGLSRSSVRVGAVGCKTARGKESCR